MTIKRCRLVELIDNQLEVSDYPIERFAEAMAAKGHPFIGENCNPSQREELQGAPKFSGLCGPMWDGDALRYETREAYAVLSL